MNKQKKQAIKQMVLAAILCAAVVIPGMIAVNVATVKEKAEQAKLEEQTKQAMAAKIADIKAVVEEEPETQTCWDIPLDVELQKYIVEQSEAHGIQPEIVIAMIKQESNYKADTIGDNGDSYGLCQIQPKWHYKRMAKLGCTDLLNPYQNVTVCIDYLAELLDRYDGDMAKALTAYNRGSYSGTVTAYAKSVLEKAERL